MKTKSDSSDWNYFQKSLGGYERHHDKNGEIKEKMKVEKHKIEGKKVDSC